MMNKTEEMRTPKRNKKEGEKRERERERDIEGKRSLILLVCFVIASSLDMVAYWTSIALDALAVLSRWKGRRCAKLALSHRIGKIRVNILSYSRM